MHARFDLAYMVVWLLIIRFEDGPRFAVLRGCDVLGIMRQCFRGGAIQPMAKHCPLAFAFIAFLYAQCMMNRTFIFTFRITERS